MRLGILLGGCLQRRLGLALSMFGPAACAMTLAACGSDAISIPTMGNTGGSPKGAGGASAGNGARAGSGGSVGSVGGGATVGTGGSASPGSGGAPSGGSSSVTGGNASSSGASSSSVGGSSSSSGASSSSVGGSSSSSGGSSASSAGSSSTTGGSGTAAGGTTAGVATTGLLFGDYCLPECLDSATADADGDGCGNADGKDCIVPGSELAAGTTACDPASAAAPPAGDGYRMGCECIRPCDSADADAADNTPDDGWGWEHGTNCMVAGSTAVEGKNSCVPPALPTGDGYWVTGEDGLERCVPACEHPEFVDNADGWGYEKRQTCIVQGSTAESQVSRCALVQSDPVVEPGDGYLLLVGDPGVETCVPPCETTTEADSDNGWGWEQERNCIVPGTKPSVQGLPCVPPPADVTGNCPQSLTCPVVDGNTINCGCMWVDGFAERKAEIVAAIDAAGSQSYGRYFLASAMMETNNLKTDYPRGDNKGGDASCWGLCKQNLGMIRQCHSSITNESQAAALNSDLTLDIQVYNECRAKFGNNWWNGHRMGANNLGLNTYDIRAFKAAMDWTDQMLQEGDGHYSDDVRFWVDIPAI